MCPILIFYNWIPPHSHVNYVQSNGFFFAVSLMFAERLEYATDFFNLKLGSQRLFNTFYF